ncbi:hypothetical protein M0Q97_08685 [Candidatus Dojkabacteria bacterium]|jgi:hypothetical protein|nr:hypothetical protein [Candidatus Dojkabacteria bacterium]
MITKFKTFENIDILNKPTTGINIPIKNQNNDGNSFKKLYGLYGYVYFPNKLIRLLNDYEYNGTEFLNFLNGLNGNIHDNTYHSEITRNKKYDKMVIDGYILSYGKLSEDKAKEIYLNNLIYKLNIFNKQDTINNKDLENYIKIEEFGIIEIVDEKSKNEIIETYF